MPVDLAEVRCSGEPPCLKCETQFEHFNLAHLNGSMGRLYLYLDEKLIYSRRKFSGQPSDIRTFGQPDRNSILSR